MVGGRPDELANIGAAERRKRALFGVIALAAGGAWLVTDRAGSFSGALVLFALFWFAALGLLQARRKI
jgi:hypothetical protein